MRGGVNWLVARSGGEIRLGRISDDPSVVFAWCDSRRVAAPAGERFYCSPVPGGALAVSGTDSVTLYEDDGRVRWTYPHPAWESSYGASGACAADASGSLLLAVTPPDARPGGDVCVALDLTTGEPVAQNTVPSFYGSYEFLHCLAAQEETFLNAAQGQDPAYSLLVCVDGGALRYRVVGTIDEPFTGNSIAPGEFLTMAIDGEYLRRHRPGSPEPLTVQARAVCPDDLVFAVNPGFLDRAGILLAAAPDPWGDASRHFILDAATLHPAAELHYPYPTNQSPLAMGDGTWLTIQGDTVRRWRAG